MRRWSLLVLGGVAITCAIARGGEPAVDADDLFDPADYRDRVVDIAARRARLFEDLEGAVTASERDAVLQRARHTWELAVVHELVPAWLGTPWTFSGTSETPGRGTIACGYFVSTVLRDSGLRVERARLAQQAAERIIESLTSRAHVRRFSDAPLARFIARVEAMGEGVFVVGLDYHVGFLVHEDGRLSFVHSAPPHGVVQEDAAAAELLRTSRYRVVGHVSADDALIERWLRRGFIRTRRR